MDIRKLCYELYKIHWKKCHMITPEREMDSLKNYYEESWTESYTYDEYLFENGYNGALYVCYEEFCEAEYRDGKYMRELLDDDNLIKKYLADVEIKD